MPGDEYRHRGHHPLRKAVRWGKVRDLFDQGGERTGVIELTATFVTFGDVPLEGRRAESNLVVEELIDFVGQEMSVVHCASFTRWCRGVFQEWWIGGLVDWWIGGLMDWWIGICAQLHREMEHQNTSPPEHQSTRT